MHTRDELIRLYSRSKGDFLWKYMRNKHTGGRNNRKGSMYENFVAVYRLACLIESNADPERTLISSQVQAFIDDLVIEDIAGNAIEYYQIRDVADLRWDNKQHPLSDDVEVQYALCSQLGRTPHIEIVVSRAEVQLELQKKLPASIRDKVIIGHFKGASSINNLIRTNTAFRLALESVCSIKNPSVDKLDLIGSLLLGAWTGIVPHRVPLKQFYDRCVGMNPNFIKGGDMQLSTKLSEILSGIPGFNFQAQNGYLVWSYMSADNGALGLRIGSKEFEQWENDIFELASLQSFEQLEPYLSAS